MPLNQLKITIKSNWKKRVNLKPLDIENILKKIISFPAATIGRFRAKKGVARNNQIKAIGTNKKPITEPKTSSKKIGKSIDIISGPKVIKNNNIE